MEASSRRSLQILLLFSSISLQFFSGLSDDSSSSKKKVDSHATSHSSTGTKVVIICLALVAVGLFSFFLFKLYQKKKREEQYARLLKLFEEDDELELELGLRDWTHVKLKIDLSIVEASQSFIVSKTSSTGCEAWDVEMCWHEVCYDSRTSCICNDMLKPKTKRQNPTNMNSLSMLQIENNKILYDICL